MFFWRKKKKKPKPEPTIVSYGACGGKDPQNRPMDRVVELEDGRSISFILKPKKEDKKE